MLTSYKRKKSPEGFVPSQSLTAQPAATTPDGAVVDALLVSDELKRRRLGDDPQTVSDAQVAHSIRDLHSLAQADGFEGIQRSIAALHQDMTTLHQDMTTLHQEMTRMTSSQAEVTSSLASVRDELHSLNGRLSTTRMYSLNRNGRATDPEHPLFPIPRETDLAVPNWFPAHLGAFRRMNHQQANELVAFYEIRIPRGSSLSDKISAIAEYCNVF